MATSAVAEADHAPVSSDARLSANGPWNAPHHPCGIPQWIWMTTPSACARACSTTAHARLRSCSTTRVSTHGAAPGCSARVTASR